MWIEWVLVLLNQSFVSHHHDIKLEYAAEDTLQNTWRLPLIWMIGRFGWKREHPSTSNCSKNIKTLFGLMGTNCGTCLSKRKDQLSSIIIIINYYQNQLSSINQQASSANL
jgi:hypothetical protein